MTVVAVDLGKTTCRVRTDTSPASEASGPGAPGLAAVDGPTHAAGAVVDSLRLLGDPPDGGWHTLTIGAAGALAAPKAAAECADILLRETGARRVVITSDAVTAHLGAFGGETGVTVIAGTGAAAIAVDAAGEVAIGDGTGPETGDRGSGAWIGRTALQRADEGATTLAGRAEQRYGPAWRDLLAEGRDYELARRRGEFVADIAALTRVGDLTAMGVVREAAEQLADTTRRTANQLRWPNEDVQVALVGGLAGLGTPLTEPLAAAIKPARLVRPQGSALDGAALLSDRHDLPHERLVTRREQA